MDKYLMAIKEHSFYKIDVNKLEKDNMLTYFLFSKPIRPYSDAESLIRNMRNVELLSNTKVRKEFKLNHYLLFFNKNRLGYVSMVHDGKFMDLSLKNQIKLVLSNTVLFDNPMHMVDFYKTYKDTFQFNAQEKRKFFFPIRKAVHIEDRDSIFILEKILNI